MRRGSERAGRTGGRITRGLGEPALFAILLSALVSGLFMVLGVVAGDALGLTPLAFFAAGLFFVITMATYVEGSSLHPERGGASTFARYAFDELWSFIAGWAILLDYLIVMAIGAVAISRLPRRLLERSRRRLRRDRHRALAIAYRRHAERPRAVGRPARDGAAPVSLRPRAARGGRTGRVCPGVGSRGCGRLRRPGLDARLGRRVVCERGGRGRADRSRGGVRPGRRGSRRPPRPSAGGPRDRRRGARAVRGSLGGGADGGAGRGRRDRARRPLHRGAGARHGQQLRARLADGRLSLPGRSDRRGDPDRGHERPDARAVAAVVLAGHQQADPERGGPPQRAPRNALHRDHAWPRGSHSCS